MLELFDRKKRKKSCIIGEIIALLPFESKESIPNARTYVKYFSGTNTYQLEY